MPTKLLVIYPCGYSGYSSTAEPLPDCPCLYSVSNSQSFINILGKYSSRQAVCRVVGSINNFIKCLEFDQLLDRAKNLKKTDTILNKFLNEALPGAY